MHDDADHRTAAELFAEWFETNIKSGDITADFFTTETEEEEEDNK